MPTFTKRASVTEARSGFRGRHMLMVLIASAPLAVIAKALVWAFHAHDIKMADAAMVSQARGQPADDARTTSPGYVMIKGLRRQTVRGSRG